MLLINFILPTSLSYFMSLLHVKYTYVYVYVYVRHFLRDLKNIVLLVCCENS